MSQALTRSTRSWKSIVGRFRSLFGLALPGGAESLEGPVRLGLHAPPHAYDAAQRVSVDTATAEAKGFSPLHVEPLLDEAARLLDRAEVDRERHNALAERAVLDTLEMQDFTANDDIRAREVATGYLKLSHDESRALLEAVRHERLSARAIDERLQNLLEQGPLGPGQRKRYADRTGLLYKVLRLPWIRNFQPREVLLIDGASLDQNADDLSRENAERDLELQASVASVRRESARGRAGAAEARLESLETRERVHREVAALDFERAQFYRCIQQRRVEEAVREGGVLNHPQRMKPIRARVVRDFRDAYARLVAVRQGLELLYGIDQPLPQAGADGLYDATLDWVRTATERLARFRRGEQAYVYSISLRDRLGRGFRSGISETWRLTLGTSDFAGQRHVRLRGVSAFARDETNRRYRLSVLAPRSGSLLLAGRSQPVSVEQRAVPPCFLGSVGARGSTATPEVAGRETLHNCSPIGKWTISVAEDQRAVARDDLEDVELDLHLLASLEVPGGG